MKRNPATLRETNFEATVTRFEFSGKFSRKSKRASPAVCPGQPPKGIRCATSPIPESIYNCLWLAIAPLAIPTIFSRFVERAERVDALAARGAR